MRKPRTIILGLCGVLATVILLTVLGRINESAYQGQTLSQLIVRYNSEDALQKEQAAEGITHIGTNAIPYLLQWMQQEVKPESGWITNLRLKSATRFGKDLLPRRKASRATLAVRAFAALGPDADAAVDSLIGLMNQPTVGHAQIAAAYALAYSRTPLALSPLIAAITNELSPIRGFAIAALRNGGTNARPAVPQLAECLKSQDNGIATVAAVTLAELKLERLIVVPVLISSIQPADPTFACLIIDVLRAYGADARPATPLLLEMLHHQDESVRFSAEGVLMEIAPEVLPNAPPQ